MIDWLIFVIIPVGFGIWYILYMQKEIYQNDKLIAEGWKRIAKLRESIDHAKFTIWEYDFKQDLEG